LPANHDWPEVLRGDGEGDAYRLGAGLWDIYLDGVGTESEATGPDFDRTGGYTRQTKLAPVVRGRAEQRPIDRDVGAHERHSRLGCHLAHDHRGRLTGEHDRRDSDYRNRYRQQLYDGTAAANTV
jgi:hypothetical protein